MLKELREISRPTGNWDASFKPVVVADGQAIPVRDIRSPLSAHKAYVVGINAKSFPGLCQKLRVQHLFFYEMRVEDLRPLAALETLTRLAIEWNTKVRDLTPLAAIEKLEALVLSNTPKTNDLGPLAGLVGLRALSITGGMWSTTVVESLEPLGSLTQLEELELLNIRTRTGGLRPLARCRNLRSLDLSNQFPTEDYAYLSVHLPETSCAMFAPYLPVQPLPNDKDVMVIGSGKPFLNSKADTARLAQYASEFEALREEYSSQR